MDLFGSYIDISFHALSSLIIAFLVANFYPKNKKNILICFVFSLIAGLFIDIDHTLDYFLSFGFSFDYRQFVSGAYFHSGKTYVLFHAFEYVIIFWIFATLTKGRKKMIFQVISLSMLAHLFIDIALFSIPVKDYFLSYRIFNHFKSFVTEEQKFWTLNIKQILGGI